MSKFKIWLLKKLIGNHVVMINVTIKDGVIHLKPEDVGLIHNCQVDTSKNMQVDVSKNV